MARLIDADKATEVLTKYLYETALNNSGEASMMCEDIAEHRLKTWIDLVPTEAEPIRHGHWEYVKKRLVRGGYVDANKCSICHKIIMPHLKPNYCPYCGAKMDEGNAEKHWKSVESVGGDR